MNKNGQVKLGDFGISKVLKDACEFAETFLGTPYFLSPEICKGLKYNFKSDIWMLGCVLYEMTTLERPFKGSNLPMLMRNIIKEEAKEIDSKYSEELRTLIKMLLKKNPMDRPSVKEIISLDIVEEKIKKFNINFNIEERQICNPIPAKYTFMTGDDDFQKEFSTLETKESVMACKYNFSTNETIVDENSNMPLSPSSSHSPHYANSNFKKQFDVQQESSETAPKKTNNIRKRGLSQDRNFSNVRNPRIITRKSTGKGGKNTFEFNFEESSEKMNHKKDADSQKNE